jgi:mannose-6-phosphate isomerase-like protein (cupin superfamily)
MNYVIGDRRFTSEGPYIARVPAGVPHTFVNTGSEPVNLVAVFASKRLDYQETGPNPLVAGE